jgi:hypothetical protein
MIPGSTGHLPAETPKETVLSEKSRQGCLRSREKTAKCCPPHSSMIQTRAGLR